MGQIQADHTIHVRFCLKKVPLAAKRKRDVITLFHSETYGVRNVDKASADTSEPISPQRLTAALPENRPCRRTNPTLSEKLRLQYSDCYAVVIYCSLLLYTIFPEMSRQQLFFILPFLFSVFFQHTPEFFLQLLRTLLTLLFTAFLLKLP